MTALVPSTRLVTGHDIDERNKEHFPVAKKLFTVLVADGTKTKTINIDLNGRLLSAIIASPNIPTDSDFVFTILDEDGQTVYTDATVTDDAVERQDLTGSYRVCAGAGSQLKINFTTQLSGDTALFDVKLEYSSEF